MTDDTFAGAQPPTIPPQTPERRYDAFIGPNGLRAGWRLFLALAIFMALQLGLKLIVFGHGGSVVRIFSSFTPAGIFLGESLVLVCVLFTAWVMSIIEGRRFRDYGLGPDSAFGGRFWLGAIVGFAAISTLLGSLKLAGVFDIGPLALHGAEAWKYAAEWGAAFLTVAFFEETAFRGYLLFTLTSGIGFWPAAIVTSLVFGGIHLGNGGESYVGAAAAGGIGMFFCILVRKGGNLWAAIGFHAAWDWGETYFYGVADSGFIAPGHLFSAHFAGPVWLTGGSVGPEGSLLCLLLIVLLCIGAALLPGKKYPNPDAIPDPRRRKAAPKPSFLPATANQP
jgi:membrane protease YdiL (CAAX protease family)